jgi:hypothetical protein
MLNPLTVICKNCKTKLRAGSFIRKAFIAVLILGLAFGLSAGLLDFGFGIVLLVIVILAIPVEFMLWKYGRYEVQRVFNKLGEGRAQVKGE